MARYATPSWFTRFWFWEGVFMINVVELDERINKCLSILEENPRSRIFAALAEAYRRRGDVGRAFSVCKNGLRIHPDYGAAHVVMSKLYLHQNMTAQALEAVEQAIKLDGPSRSSDILLAEIHLVSGAYAQAKQILDGLARDGGSDPVVAEQRKRLKAAMRSKQVIAPPTAARDRAEAETAPSATTPGGPHGPETETRNTCTDPMEAASVLMQIPGMSYSAVYRQDGALLASRGELSAHTPIEAGQLLQPFNEIEQLVGARGWGSLNAVRVEGPRGHWGILAAENSIVVIIGTARLNYTAALRKAAQCLGQLAAVHANDVKSVMPEDTPERVPH